jgi:P-type Cu2+ transporter
MKTSVIEVQDMLSVLSVDEVEKRIGEVPGVDSVTVNFAAESATVRYDETRLEIADIKSAVRQRGHESAASPRASGDDPHKGHAASGAPPAAPAPTTPKAAPSAPVTAGAEPSTTPKPSPTTPAAAPVPGVTPGGNPQAKAATDKS